MSLIIDQSAITSPIADPIIRTATNNRPLTSPFTILIDSAEQQPFTFTGLRADSAKQYRPLTVRTETTSLGRHPNSLGDYCLAEFRGRCHIERKSIDDAIGTFLGFGGRNPDGTANVDTARRSRFIQELANLNAIECGGIVVEADFSQMWQAAPQTAKRTQETNQLSLRRQIRAWQQDFPNVQWLFCGSRREAEEETYWWFARFYEKHRKELETHPAKDGAA